MSVDRRAGVRRSARLAALVAALTVAAACANEPRTTYPPLGASPGPAGQLTDATEALVIAALGGVGLPAAESVLPYRPPEGALLAAAPRTVLQASLPDDPTGGFVMIYALQSPQAALAAAQDQASFIARNPGGIFPFTSRFVLRTVESTVVFYWWIPESATDQQTVLIEEGLLAVGTEVPILR